MTYKVENINDLRFGLHIQPQEYMIYSVTIPKNYIYIPLDIGCYDYTYEKPAVRILVVGENNLYMLLFGVGNYPPKITSTSFLVLYKVRSLNAVRFEILETIVSASAEYYKFADNINIMLTIRPNEFTVTTNYFAKTIKDKIVWLDYYFGSSYYFEDVNILYTPALPDGCLWNMLEEAKKLEIYEYIDMSNPIIQIMQLLQQLLPVTVNMMLVTMTMNMFNTMSMMLTGYRKPKEE